MRTGPTNTQLVNLISALKQKGYTDKSALWKRIASDLEKPSRQRREINLSRINRYTKENETVIVPGKVLASGGLDHKLTIAAWQFSKQALEKIAEANSKAVTITELMNESPKNKMIRIIG
jgi:large subunit ribosomal protein L18e